MILSIRIDDRLIHGQVALVWTKEFNTSRIVVANDEASKNQIMQMTLQMATPTGIKLLIKSVKDSIEVFNDIRAKELKMFVLTNSIKDALEIVEHCEVQSVNVANVGRFDATEGDDTQKIKINSQVFTTEKELVALKKLAEKSIPVYHQVIPSNHKIPIKNLLKGIN